MAPIPVVAPTIVRFSLRHNVPGGRVANTVHDVSLDEFAGSRSAAVTALVPLVVGQYQDSVAAFLPLGVTFTGCQFLDIDSLTGHGGFQAPVGGKPVTGTVGGALQPPEVTWLLHKQCVHNRTERNGRVYHPGVREAEVDDAGVVLPAVATLVAGWFNNWKNAINDGIFFPPATVALRVVHVAGHTGVPLPGFPNGKPNAWTSSDVDSFQVDNKVGTQRRRLRG